MLALPVQTVMEPKDLVVVPIATTMPLTRRIANLTKV
jgi:hypothetical protein